MLLVAVGEGRTLSSVEEVQYQQHVAGCFACRTVVAEVADEAADDAEAAAEDAVAAAEAARAANAAKPVVATAGPAGALSATMAADPTGALSATMAADPTGALSGTMAVDPSGALSGTMAADPTGALPARVAADPTGALSATMADDTNAALLATVADDTSPALSATTAADMALSIPGGRGGPGGMRPSATGLTRGRSRWISRISDDAFDDTDLLVLPTVDPIVFAKGARLAQGGMGRITRARDRRLGRDVAIKEVLSPYLHARFEREAMITARLQHPAIVPVYEAGIWPDGSAFYTMRLVSGGTLSDAIERATTLEARLALMPHVIALTEALGYAHSRRVVHRDLKPANVLVGEFGETVVIDWGLAKELDRGGPGVDGVDGVAGIEGGAAGPASLELTRAGSVVGTPCFIAPEQAAGEDIDERVDVYALGAILYNLLVGHPPHWDSIEHTAERLIDAARELPPTPIGQLVPRAPADLRAIVERAMAHDKAARYPTAKAMAEELRRFATGRLLASRSYSARELVVRWVRRHRAAVAVAAIAIAVLAIGGALSLRQMRHALAESQLERGRQLVIDGDPAQAAPYLADALRVLSDDPVARRLAAIAERDVPRRLGSFRGTAPAFRPDGNELAIGRADGWIAMIDLAAQAPASRAPATAAPATAAPARLLPPLGGPVVALAYAPDGQQLAVATALGAYLRDATTGAWTAIASDQPAAEVAFLPGRRLAVATRTALRVVEVDGGRVIRALPAGRPHGLTLSGDARRLVAITDDGATVWPLDDLAHPTELHAGDNHFSAAFDGDDVLIAGLDGVTRWHAGQRTATLLPGSVVSLTRIADHAFLADGTVLHTDTGQTQMLRRSAVQDGAVLDRTHVLTGGYDHTIRLWDTDRAARPIAVLDAADATASFAVDPTGRRAVSRGTGPDAPIELWDVAWPATRTFAIGAPIDNLIADGDRIAVQIGETTRLISAALAPVAFDRPALDGWPLRFLPDHGDLVTARAGVLKIYRRDGSHVRDLPGDDPALRAAIGAGMLWHVAATRTSDMFAISSERRVWLLDANWHLPVAASARPLVEEPEGAPWIAAIALDDHGHVITGYQDGTLKLWDARTGELLVTRSGHATAISELEIRGDVLYSTSWDPTLRLWSLPKIEPRGVFKRLSSVAVSPSGQTLVTVDSSAEVGVWDGAQDRLLEQAPAAHGLDYVVLVAEDRAVGSSAGGELELFDLSPSRSAPLQ
jgi:serine/threonine protein kinase/WD40 repeat protein